MTTLTWLFFGLSASAGFLLGRIVEKRSNKKMMKLVSELIEEARRMEEQKKTSRL